MKERDKSKTKTKQKVFISSRIEELRHERDTAYAACFERGFLPLMFEVEPIEDLKLTIDQMVDNADYFLGIYFHTVGSPHFNLMSLTPIEYELCRFIRMRCQLFKKQTCNKRIECYAVLRRLLTGHYSLDKRSPNVCGQENDNITKCKEAVNSVTDRIVIYHKYPFDEKSLSPELLAFGIGLQRLHIGHLDFHTRWDLAKLIHEDKRLKPEDEKKSPEPQEDDDYCSIDMGKLASIQYEGKDQPGQIAQLTLFALGLSLNVERLLLEVKGDDTVIKVWLSSWGKDGVELNSCKLEELIKTRIEFSRKLDALREKYREIPKEQEALGTDRNTTGPIDDPIFMRYSTFSLDRFIVPKGQSSTSGEPIKVSLCSADNKEQKPFEMPKLEDNQVLVKVIHLNCPGVLNRFTKLLSGGMPDRWKSTLNIKWCLTEPGTRGVLFGRTGDEDMEENKDDTANIFPNYRDRLLQTTQMVLELSDTPVEDMKAGSSPECLGTNKAGSSKEKLKTHDLDLLHTALNSIIGVEQVRICRPTKKNKK